MHQQYNLPVIRMVSPEHSNELGDILMGLSLQSAGAQEFSHMFFSSGISSMFATHPPLPIRIKRIDPNWKNAYPDTDKISETASQGSQVAGVSGFTGASHSGSTSLNQPRYPN